MAMQFELVSPERRLASQEADAVRIPGADGDMTAMAGHAPVITSLRPGVLTVEHGGSETSFAVTGGFAEVGADGTTVLAERALPTDQVTQEVFSEWLSDAKAAVDAAADDAKDSAAKLVEDMSALGSTIGLSVA
jgi:F-type H+-transporting ATPase subunit epsilon